MYGGALCSDLLCSVGLLVFLHCFFCKQKAAYAMRIRDGSSDVCSSDLVSVPGGSALVLDLKGYIVDQAHDPDPFRVFMGGPRIPSEVEVRDVVRAIEDRKSVV